MWGFQKRFINEYRIPMRNIYLVTRRERGESSTFDNTYGDNFLPASK